MSATAGDGGCEAAGDRNLKSRRTPGSTRLLVDLAVVIVVGSSAVLALGRAALSWDGSYYLLAAQRSSGVPVFFGRYGQAVLLSPTWLAAKLAGDHVSEAVFVITYASVPACSIVACRLLSRDEPRLMIWPLIGLVVALPGQLFLVSEATILVQVGWPMLFAIRRRKSLTVALLAVFAASLHPLAFVMLGLACLYCWGESLPLCAVTTGLLAVATRLRPLVPIERQSTQLAIVARHVHSSFGAVPVLLVLSAYIVAMSWRLPTAPVMVLGMGTLVLAALWAARPHQWAYQLDYRAIVMVVTIPLLVGAAFLGPVRLPPVAAVWSAAAVALVLTVQTVQWQHLLAVVSANGHCEARSVDGGTAVDHWATPALTRVLTSRCPPGPVPAPLVAGMPRILR